MIVKKNIASILLIMLVSGSMYSQEKLSGKEEKQMLQKAEFYYEDEESKNISKALKLFEQLSENKPADPYYKLMKGICCSYFKHRKVEALKTLLAVKAENSQFNEVDFYLGRAYAVNNRFDEAIAVYQKYIAYEEIDDDRKAEARQKIIYCENAKIYLQDSLEVEITSVGSPINSDYSEYVPVIAPDESMMIFTYSGPKSKGGLLGSTGKPDLDGRYYEDIMISYKLNEDWLEPVSIAENINDEGDNASIALSVDGQMLFVYGQTKSDQGDIFASRLVGNEWGKPEKLKGDVNSEFWEGSATLTSDGKMIYFSSAREGGFGGRDIYSAALQADGSWGEVANLGPVINTRFDEDAPFIHPDKRTMYFSSKGHSSMGDYDIFYTYLTDEGWDEPENVKYPVNTIDDDRYYVLSADAKTGYYSTSGRSELGTHDIFTVSPGHFGKRPVLALIVGVTQADGEVAEADITVTNDKTGELEGKFKSNATSGKYMLALTPGNKYKIAIEVEGYETKIDYIDIESLETYVEVEHDFNVYAKEQVVGISDDVAPLQGKIDNQIERFKKENTEEGYNEMIYAKVLNDRGEEKMAGVQYYIDADCLDSDSVGAEVLAKINTVSYPDGSSKSVIGPFQTLLASEIVRQSLVSKDSSCNQLEVKVNDNGTEKSFKQFYVKEYKKTEFAEGNIHDKLTGSDTENVVENENAINLEDIKDVNLSGDNLADAAGKKITGLKFKVEIGAVKDTNDFQLAHLEKYGKITSKTYPDGVTRYTFGSFKTLKEAEDFKQMLAEKEADSKDAFVTVFVFGQDKKVDDIEDVQRKELGIPLKGENVVGGGPGKVEPIVADVPVVEVDSVVASGAEVEPVAVVDPIVPVVVSGEVVGSGVEDLENVDKPVVAVVEGEAVGVEPVMEPEVIVEPMAVVVEESPAVVSEVVEPVIVEEPTVAVAEEGESVAVDPVVEPVVEVRPELVDPVIVDKSVVEVEESVEAVNLGPCDSGVKDFAWFVGKDLNDKKVYAKLIEFGGNSCAEGLEFRVQIGAYRFPENYKWNHLKKYGEPMVVGYPDGVTRFTQGTYNTLAVAEELRQKIIRSGQKDAWITPFYNGERILLEELFKVNFYGKSVN